MMRDLLTKWPVFVKDKSALKKYLPGSLWNMRLRLANRQLSHGMRRSSESQRSSLDRVPLKRFVTPPIQRHSTVTVTPIQLANVLVFWHVRTRWKCLTPLNGTAIFHPVHLGHLLQMFGLLRIERAFRVGLFVLVAAFLLLSLFGYVNVFLDHV